MALEDNRFFVVPVIVEEIVTFLATNEFPPEIDDSLLETDLLPDLEPKLERQLWEENKLVKAWRGNHVVGIRSGDMGRS